MQHCSSYAALWVWLQQSSESLLSDHKSSKCIKLCIYNLHEGFWWYVQIIIHTLVHFLAWCFPCSAQCWSVCIPSKAVIIAEHQAVLDSAKDRGVLRNLSRGLAWTGEDSWNYIQSWMLVKRGVKYSIVWGAQCDRVWAVSFPHIYLLSLSLLWHVGVCCAQSQAGCVDWCGLITPDLQTHRPKPDRDLFTSQT